MIKQEEDLFILKARDVKKFLTDIKNTFRNMVVYVMTVEYKTGKEGLEFTKERAK